MATQIVDILKYIITGDNKGLKQASKEGDAAVAKMSAGISNALLGVTKRYLGWAAVIYGAGKALGFTIRETADSEKAYRGLAVAVDASGQSWVTNEARIRSFLESFQKLTGFTDEQGARALQVLIQNGMDLEQALQVLPRVAALSAANFQEDLTPAAEVLGRAFNGATESLRRWNIFVSDTIPTADKFGATLDFIDRLMGPQAQANIQGVTGQWKMFKNELSEVVETLGSSAWPHLERFLNGLVNITQKMKAAAISLFGAAAGKTKDNFLGFPPEFFSAHGASAMRQPSKDVIEKGERERLEARRKTLDEIAQMERATAELTADAQTDALQQIMAEEERAFEFRRQMGEDVYTEEIEFLEKIQAAAERAGLWDLAAEIIAKIQDANNAATLNTRVKWEQNFGMIINGAHRIASEFGRFMNDAVENFLHTTLDAFDEIRSIIKSIPAGGSLGAGGALGIFGAAFGVVGSIVDMFSGGAQEIAKSNYEVVRAIQQWIQSLRGSTQEELGAVLSDIANAEKEIAKLRGLSGILDKDKMEQFIKAITDSLEGFSGIEGVFEQQFGRKGTVEEILNFWKQMIAEQGSTFAIIAKGLKSPEDVLEFLESQTRLDLQRAQQLIEFFAAQNDFTAQEKLKLYEALQSILGDRITESDLMNLLDIIRQLKEETDVVTEQGRDAIQITRSVAGITENQANLVVGALNTLITLVGRILALIENAAGGLNAVPMTARGGAVVFQPGSVNISAAGSSGAAMAREFVGELRLKGVKI